MKKSVLQEPVCLDKAALRDGAAAVTGRPGAEHVPPTSKQKHRAAPPQRHLPAPVDAAGAASLHGTLFGALLNRQPPFKRDLLISIKTCRSSVQKTKLNGNSSVSPGLFTCRCGLEDA